MPGEVSRDHLQRKAFVYVRQSTRQQVCDHRESQDIQRQLAQRAAALGWPADRVETVTCDQGLSAGLGQTRPGFQRLLHEVCEQQAGAVLFWSASRLARNSQEWHQMLDLCRIFNVLVIDHEGVYDPRLAGDRLFLGMKGSLSEYEVQQFQALALAASLNKARRGQLFKALPPGFIKGEDGRLELDPDERIRQAIGLVFERFEQLRSVSQAQRWFAANRLELPVRDCRLGKGLIWRSPSLSTLYQILTNPLYAGAYVYPRRQTVPVVIEGRVIKKLRRYLPIAKAEVVLKDHFPGYISWEQFERNQQIMAGNAARRGSTVPGAAREGRSLLPGLLHCGQCGRRLSVRYKKAATGAYYYCRCQTGRSVCGLHFNGQNLEDQVIAQLLTAIQPQGLAAAQRAEDLRGQDNQRQLQALALSLEEARYEAGRIERQLQQVEPEKCQVFRTLSARWEEALARAAELEARYRQTQHQPPPLSEAERQRLHELGRDVQQLWQDPNGPNRVKTEIVRLLIAAVWVRPTNRGSGDSANCQPSTLNDNDDHRLERSNNRPANCQPDTLSDDGGHHLEQPNDRPANCQPDTLSDDGGHHLERPNDRPANCQPDTLTDDHNRRLPPQNDGRVNRQPADCQPAADPANQQMEAIIHWHGGAHTRLTFTRSIKRDRSGQARPDALDTTTLIRHLTQTCPDDQIARVLNLLKHPAPADSKYKTWSAGAVNDYRRAQRLSPFSQTAYDAGGQVSLTQAASILGIAPESVKRLIRTGIIAASQVVTYAPWVIARTALDQPAVKQAVATLKNGRRIPPVSEAQQEMAV